MYFTLINAMRQAFDCRLNIQNAGFQLCNWILHSISFCKSIRKELYNMHLGFSFRDIGVYVYTMVNGMLSAHLIIGFSHSVSGCDANALAWAKLCIQIRCLERNYFSETHIWIYVNLVLKEMHSLRNSISEICK